MKLPGKTMGIGAFALDVDWPSISMRAENATVPTSSCFTHVVPEPVFDRPVSFGELACVATTKPIPVPSLRRFNPELFTALVAVDREHGFSFVHNRRIAPDSGDIQVVAINSKATS